MEGVKPNKIFSFLHLFFIVLLLFSTVFFFSHSLNNQTDIPKLLVFYLFGGFFILTAFLFICIKNTSVQFTFDKSIDLPVLLFLLFLILSTVFSVNPHISFFGPYHRQISLITYLYLTVIYFLIPVVFSSSRISLIINFLKLLGCMVALHSILQYLGIDPLNIQSQGNLRPVSTLGNGIFTAGIFLMIFPYSFSDALHKQKLTLNISICLLIAVAIILTQTRTAYLAFTIEILIGACLLFYSNGKDTVSRKRITLKILIALAAVIILAGLIIILFHQNLYVKRFLSVLDFVNSSRFSLWQDTYGIIRSFPFFGTGIGCFANTADELISAKTKYFEIKKIYDNAHSNFLQTGSTMGLPALFVFIFILVQSARLSVKSFISQVNPKIKTLSLALLMIISGYTFFSIADFDDITILLCFFLTLSFIKTIYSSEKTKNILINRKVLLFALLVGSIAMSANFVLQINKYSADKEYKLSKDAFIQGFFKQSVEHLNTAIENYPDCGEYRYTLAYYVYDYCYRNEKFPSEQKSKLLRQGYEELKRCEKYFYSNLKIKALRSLICYEEGKNNEADALRDEIFSKDTLMVDYAQELAKQYLKQKKFDEMIKYLTLSCKHDYNSDGFLFYILERLKNEGEIDYAIQCSRIALNIKPVNQSLINFLQTLEAIQQK